jgi:hypothetical protein
MYLKDNFKTYTELTIPTGIEISKYKKFYIDRDFKCFEESFSFNDSLTGDFYQLNRLLGDTSFFFDRKLRSNLRVTDVKGNIKLEVKEIVFNKEYLWRKNIKIEKYFYSDSIVTKTTYNYKSSKRGRKTDTKVKYL